MKGSYEKCTTKKQKIFFEEYEKSNDKQYIIIYTGLKSLVIKKMRKAERHIKKLKGE